ncbi:MAG: L,D-transpeptidase family protein [Alphaproteobacteria bacterium]|nr:L,D-transpeptidase family protein [Alphaproteobacteria bacterium]
MKLSLKFIIVLVLAFGVSACTKFKTYNGPEVTRLVIMKSERKLYLFSNQTTLKTYNIDLGFAPVGDKKVENDGKTPEGSYTIDRRNPNSSYHLSIGISYPNEQDKAEAKALGKSPGGDIFIHGGPTLFRDRNKADWTWGCISVSNREIEEIYAMVRDGTPIDIFP